MRNFLNIISYKSQGEPGVQGDVGSETGQVGDDGLEGSIGKTGEVGADGSNGEEGSDGQMGEQVRLIKTNHRIMMYISLFRDILSHGCRTLEDGQAVKKRKLN